MELGRVSVLLVYEPANRRQPVPLARVVDGGLAAAAARVAVEQAGARATQVARQDPTLGVLERAEARRLRDVLGALVPEVSGPLPAPIM